MITALTKASLLRRHLPRIGGGTAIVLLAIAFTFMFMGWFAAFTTAGFEFIIIGTAIVVAVVVLSRRLLVVIAAMILLLVTWFLPFIIAWTDQLIRLVGA